MNVKYLIKPSFIYTRHYIAKLGELTVELGENMPRMHRL